MDTGYEWVKLNSTQNSKYIKPSANHYTISCKAAKQPQGLETS